MKYERLIISPITDKINDKKNDTIYFGIESHSNINNFTKKNTLFIEQWVDNIELKNAIDYTQNVYDYTLRTLVPWLNSIHKTSYPSIYWERIIGSFLINYIHTLYDKYVKIQSKTNLLQDLKPVLLSESNFQVPYDWFEFIQAVRQSDAFNYQILTQVIKLVVGGDFPLLNYQWDLKHDIGVINHKEGRSFLIKAIRKIFDRGHKSNTALYVSLFSTKQVLKIFLLSKFTIAPIFDNMSVQIYPYAFERKIRETIPIPQNADNFAKIILQTLKINFPFAYIEGYKELDNLSDKLIKKKIPKKIITGIGLGWNAYFGIWAAKCSLNGAKLYGLQHGGTYGESIPSYGEVFERKVSDYYITFGWKEDKKTIAMPAPRFIGIEERKNNNKTNKILWVTTLDSQYTYFLSLLPFGNRFLKYFKLQEKMYFAIKSTVRNNIRIRLYPDDFNWNTKERWMKTDPKIHFSNPQISFHEDVMNSKMVIIDHFGGTTTLECLRMNVPCIIIGNLDLFTIRDSAQYYYNLLNEVGILHYSVESAAAVVNSEYERINNWWFSAKRQNVIKEYTEHFALNTKHPIHDWVKQFS